MTPRLSRPLALAALAAGLFTFAPGVRSRAEDKKPDAPTFTAAQVSFYEKEVLPVLTQHCLKCHGADPEKVKGGLDLTTRKAALAGGESGPSVTLAKPGESLLLKAIHYKDDNHKMPPKGKLPDKEIATLEKWVKDGLPVTADRVGGDIAKAPPKGGVVTEEAKRYWAYSR